MIPEIKTCTKCKVEKPKDEFRIRRRKNVNDFLNSSCKSCEKEFKILENKRNGRKRYEARILKMAKIEIPKSRICTKCGVLKSAAEFHKSKLYGIRFDCKECRAKPINKYNCIICDKEVFDSIKRSFCSKECHSLWKKEYMLLYNPIYRSENLESLKIQRARYYQINKEFIDSKNRIYARNNKERRNFCTRRNYHKSLKYSRLYNSNKQKEASKDLKLYYVRRLLRKSTNFTIEQIKQQPELIKLTRTIIQIKRKIKNEQENELSGTC